MDFYALFCLEMQGNLLGQHRIDKISLAKLLRKISQIYFLSFDTANFECVSAVFSKSDLIFAVLTKYDHFFGGTSTLLVDISQISVLIHAVISVIPCPTNQLYKTSLDDIKKHFIRLAELWNLKTKLSCN